MAGPSAGSGYEAPAPVTGAGVTVSDLLAVPQHRALPYRYQVLHRKHWAPHQPLALGSAGHQLGGARYWENTPAPHIPHHPLGARDW